MGSQKQCIKKSLNTKHFKVQTEPCPMFWPFHFKVHASTIWKNLDVLFWSSFFKLHLIPNWIFFQREPKQKDTHKTVLWALIHLIRLKNWINALPCPLHWISAIGTAGFSRILAAWLGEYLNCICRVQSNQLKLIWINLSLLNWKILFAGRTIFSCEPVVKVSLSLMPLSETSTAAKCNFKTHATQLCSCNSWSKCRDKGNLSFISYLHNQGQNHLARWKQIPKYRVHPPLWGDSKCQLQTSIFSSSLSTGDRHSSWVFGFGIPSHLLEDLGLHTTCWVRCQKPMRGC